VLKDATHYLAQLGRHHEAAVIDHGRRTTVGALIAELAAQAGQTAPPIDLGPPPGPAPAPADRGARWCPALVNVPMPDDARRGDAASALAVRVNHGRWVIDCPDCGGAQLACRTDPRFFCTDCGNAAVGGAWRPVRWPADAAGVEAALGARPLGLQNWTEDEPVGLLRAENAHLRGSQALPHAQQGHPL
jgi:hypothetical protein